MRIARLDATQLAEAAALLTRAFFDYSVWAWLVPDSRQRREIMPSFMEMSLRYGLLAGEVYAAGDPLRGVAIWEPPGHLDGDVDLDPDGTKTGWNEIPERMGEQFMARFRAVIDTQRPVRARVSGGAPIWYLRPVHA